MGFSNEAGHKKGVDGGMGGTDVLHGFEIASRD
jgi:hypothetical protein